MEKKAKHRSNQYREQNAKKTLEKDASVAEKLSALGVKEEGIPALAKSALADVCTPGNPKETCIEDIEALYRKIL